MRPAGPVLSLIQPQNLRAAHHMVSNHGTAAADVARKRAQNLMACGKLDSAATWLEIARAIHDLDRPLPVA
jgi:hypothetical protein